MMPEIYDHLLAALLLLIWPIYAAYHAEESLADMALPGGRMRMFRSTMIIQWVHTAMLLTLWVAMDRSWGSLGLGHDFGTGFYVVGTLCVLFLIYQANLIGRLRRDPSMADGHREQVLIIAPMIPRTTTERRCFFLLAWTAGICEELAFRGYLIWYLAHWMPTWAGVCLAALSFGALHLYEGRVTAARITLFGVIMGALYLACGSLWILMVAHALLDLVQIKLARTILEGDPSHGQPNILLEEPTSCLAD